MSTNSRRQSDADPYPRKRANLPKSSATSSDTKVLREQFCLPLVNATDVGRDKRSLLAWADEEVEKLVRRSALMGAKELRLLARQWRR